MSFRRRPAGQSPPPWLGLHDDARSDLFASRQRCDDPRNLSGRNDDLADAARERGLSGFKFRLHPPRCGSIGDKLVDATRCQYPNATAHEIAI